MQRRTAQRAWLVYDGECPMCRNYALYLDMRDAIGGFTLVNARQGGRLVAEIQAAGYDLSEGMILKLDDRYYYGKDALRPLALLSERRGVFSLINQLLFSSSAAAPIVYPFLKAGRRALLKFKGVSPAIR